MILLLLTTVLLVPSWQVVPTAIVAADREDNILDVVAEDDDKVHVSPIPIDEVRDEPRPVATMSQREMRDRLLELYEQQVALEEVNYQSKSEIYEKGMMTEAELWVAERKLLNTKITLSTFIIEYMIENPNRVSEEREQLLSYHQRLYELAKLDYKRQIEHHTNGVVTDAQLRAYQQLKVDAEIFAIRFQLQEEQRKAMSLADAAGAGSRVTAPVAKSTKFTPAEQERLKALYQQIIEQEDENRKIIEGYYEMGDGRGNYVAFMEAKRGVIEAKITLSTFILNETDLTPQEYANERQNLRSLHEEMREAAKFAVLAAKAAYENQRIHYAEVAQYERKLTEIEIALIRLFPENGGTTEP